RVLKAPFSATVLQYLMYFSGCALFALGVKLFIDADLGTDPLHAMIIGIVGTLDTPFLKRGLRRERDHPDASGRLDRVEPPLPAAHDLRHHGAGRLPDRLLQPDP